MWPANRDEFGGLSDLLFSSSQITLPTANDLSMEYVESPGILDLDASSPSKAEAWSPDSGYDDNDPRTSISIGPTLEVIEEPESSYRFRYLKESQKPHGPLKGRNSLGKTQKHSCGPRVKLTNFVGKAVIRVWLFEGTIEEGPSPHRLVSSRGQTIVDEPHDVEVDGMNDFTASFDKLNIVHVVAKGEEYQKSYLRKKRNLARSGSIYTSTLPEVTGDFDRTVVNNEFKTKEKDICALYFEAFELCNGKYHFICSSLSQPIKNKKSPKTNAPKIVKQSHVEGPCGGGTEIMIFTEKLIKDVRIVFCDDNGWQEDAIFQESDIHKQVGIAFRTPPYKNLSIAESVNVQFYILRTTDSETSDTQTFRYLPVDNSFELMLASEKRKRPRNVQTSLTTVSVVYPTNDNLKTVTPSFYDEDVALFMTYDGWEETVNTGDLIACDSLQTINAYHDYVKDASNSSRFKKSAEAASQATGDPNTLLESSRHLHRCIISNDVSEFSQCLTPQLANVKYNRKTSLYLAVMCDRPAMVAKLLDVGADPHTLDISQSNTAIHQAILSSFACLEPLVKNCEPREIFDRDGDDPVLFATRNGKIQALDLLLSSGYSPLTRNIKDGNTPLHVAVNMENTPLKNSLLTLLLKYGADSSLYNNAGRTALQCADTSQTVELLEQWSKERQSDDVQSKGSLDLLSASLGRLELKADPVAVDNSNSSNSPEDPKPAEPFTALDDDPVAAVKVAELLGCLFLKPLLSNSRKSSQMLLNYLQKKETRATSVEMLNNSYAIVKSQIAPD